MSKFQVTAACRDAVPAPNIAFSAAVAADPATGETLDLIGHKDRGGEISDWLRFETRVSLVETRAIPRQTPALQELETGN